MYFTTIKVKGSTPLALKRHLEKLLSQFKNSLHPSPTISIDSVLDWIKERCREGNEYRFKISIEKPHQVVYKLEPYSSIEKTYCLKKYVCPFVEKDPHCKKIDFLKRLDLLKEAHSLGFEDWIFMDAQSHLLETSIANLFWIQDNIFYYPDPTLPYYFGVTLQLAIESAQEIGYQIYPIKTKELPGGCSLYLCNSMKEICEVSQVDSQVFPLNPTFFQKLKIAYANRIRQEDALLPNG